MNFIHIIYWILRSLFVLLLLSTAVSKLLDIGGFAEIIASYQLTIPNSFLMPLALILPLFELLLATMLILGIGLYLNAILLITMHSAYTILAIVTNLRGLTLDNCGCFGVFLARPMTWGTVIEDSILILFSIAFLICIKQQHDKAIS